MYTSYRISLLLLIGLGVLASSSAAAARPTVTIASGAIAGVATTLPNAQSSVNKYLGIPFAASPPVRFSPPTDPPQFNTVLDASAFKPACIQQFNYPNGTRDFNIAIFNNPAPVESEDCLYLNVFTPAGMPPAGGWSVMFWIYGGNLQFGNAGQPTYDGTSFATYQGVIVVTTNYRTNAFGFSNSPQIPVGQQNSGFLDQRKALDWVQKNICAFGGDPKKVTIFGESAGGYSVKQLLANPPSPLPFRGAILESEALGDAGSGVSSWETLVALTNCATAPSQIDCVRAVPATTIKNILEVGMIPFGPAADNITDSTDVRPAILSKKFAPVPFLIGTNAQEYRVFLAALAAAGGPPLTAAQILNATIYPAPAILQAAILAQYTQDANNQFFLASDALTDLAFTCPTSTLSNLATQNGYEVWRYYFNATFPNTQYFPNAGVYHSSEIAEVFGTYPTAGATQQEIKLSQYMQTAWANFAKNPTGGPGWPRLGTNNGLELGDLGGNGINGEQTIPLFEVDYRCLVFAPIIAIEPL